MISKSGNLDSSMISKSGHPKARRLTKIVGLALTVAYTCIASSALAQLDYKLGDVNGNGCVDAVDVSIILTEVQAVGDGSSFPCFAAADTDGNGLLTLADVSGVLMLAQNPPDPLLCQEDLTTNSCGEYNACAIECKNPCVLEDNGSGTVNLPPAGCAYQSSTQIHMLVDGLDPGTTVMVDAIHGDFQGVFTTPGGPLGGETETFDSKLRLEMQGTGTLSSFTRVIELDAPTIIDTAPRNEGDPKQIFGTAMRSLMADLSVADPDFAVLSVRAGSDHGLPSPGATVLTETNSFGVDSGFRVRYEITFVGQPGGDLDGHAGTTTGTALMATDRFATDPFLVNLPAMSRVGWSLLALGLTAGALFYWTRSRAVRS